jgi:hypothetical protein
VCVRSPQLGVRSQLLFPGGIFTDMRCYPKYTRKFCRVLYIVFDIETGFYTEKIYIGKLRDIHTF